METEELASKPVKVPGSDGAWMTILLEPSAEGAAEGAEVELLLSEGVLPEASGVPESPEPPQAAMDSSMMTARNSAKDFESFVFISFFPFFSFFVFLMLPFFRMD